MDSFETLARVAEWIQDELASDGSPADAAAKLGLDEQDLAQYLAEAGSSEVAFLPPPLVHLIGLLAGLTVGREQGRQDAAQMIGAFDEIDSDYA